MADKSYVGDIGTVIEVNMGIDISSATLIELRVKKPGNVLATWVGEVYNNNYIRYTTVEGDLNVSGAYLITPYIEIGGWKGCGELAVLSSDEAISFYVHKKYS